jgi:hypothetical protein
LGTPRSGKARASLFSKSAFYPILFPSLCCRSEKVFWTPRNHIPLLTITLSYPSVSEMNNLSHHLKRHIMFLHSFLNTLLLRAPAKPPSPPAEPRSRVAGCLKHVERKFLL